MASSRFYGLAFDLLAPLAFQGPANPSETYRVPQVICERPFPLGA
jgi:hypothetical protein